MLPKEDLKMLLCELWVTWLHLSAIRPGQRATFYLPTHLPGRWPRPCCGWERCIGWAAILKCGAETTVTTTTSSVQPDGVAEMQDVGRTATLRAHAEQPSQSLKFHQRIRTLIFVWCEWLFHTKQCAVRMVLFTDWFKFLTHWSAITAFCMLSVLHETKCRRILFIKVMIDSSTQNTVQCGWFFVHGYWLKVSNSLVCNHSILHARGLHETKCWGIFFVSGLISLFSTENTTSKKTFMENWNNLQQSF